MKAWKRDASSRKMTECEVDEKIIRDTPFDSEYYTLVSEFGDNEDALDAAEKLEDETGHMHIAKGGKVFCTLDAKTINL